MKLPITVIVLTYNEEENIKDCLDSVIDWADEIVVVDSYSRDKSIELARSYTDKVFQHPFENYSRQRNWAQDNLPIRNEWVFHIDADERVSPELADELKAIFIKNQVDADGFLIPRRTIFMGRWIKHGGHYPVYHLRLFKRSMGRCEDREYDQHFMMDGKVKVLNGDIINIMDDNLDKWLERLNVWSTKEAKEVLASAGGRQVKPDFWGTPIEKRRWWRGFYYRIPIFIRPLYYFIYRYFFRLGFLDGMEGLIFHLVQGFWYRFIVDAKIFAMKRRIS